MKKLYEVLGKQPKAGDVGIEIECEGKGFTEVDTALWRCEDDGSLRGRYPDSRIEYILNQPIPIENVKYALGELNVAIKDAKPDFSFRTSVHVHVNILHLTSVECLSFIYTYLLLEEAMLNYCGSTRKGNRFCLRLQDAGGMNDVLNQVFGPKGFTALAEWSEDSIRYSAMNLASIYKYGSIEFRAMRGTLDVETLDIWANALISIRNFACHNESCLEVHDKYADMGPESFLEHVLGSLAVHFKYKKLVQDVQRSYSLSIDLPYIYQKSLVKVKKPVKKPICVYEELLKKHTEGIAAAAVVARIQERVNALNIAVNPMDIDF